MLEEWIKYILHCDPTFYFRKKSFYIETCLEMKKKIKFLIFSVTVALLSLIK